MKYVSQLEYAHIPYPTRVKDPAFAPNGKPTTGKSSGCGLCSACMAIDILTDTTLDFEESVRMSIECGANHMAGTDISKFILRHAAKREKNIEFAVASSYHLPLADQSVDLLLNCFSPLALEEFLRVLKPGGYFLYVVPAAEHLWEMKQVLYDEPYPNEEKETPYEGFSYEAIVPVDAVITLENQADIHALFQMTPYYWKTPKAGAERLAALASLQCRISFRIHIFKKL